MLKIIFNEVGLSHLETATDPCFQCNILLHDALVGNPEPRKIKIHKIHTVKLIPEIFYPLEPPLPPTTWQTYLSP